MKISELMAYLSKCNQNLDIVVLTNNNNDMTFGRSPHTNVISASTGIDWDQGLLLLTTEVEIIEEITEYAEKKKYVIKIENEDKFLMKGWTQKEAYCSLFEDALVMTLSEAKEVLDFEETIFEAIYENGEIKLVKVMVD